jgi:hypothetical protein
MRIDEARFRQILMEEMKVAMEEGDDDAMRHGEMYPTPVDEPELEDEDDSEFWGLNEKKGVKKRKGKKASAGSVAVFKKAASKAKGGEQKKKRAGFDAVKKSAEDWGAENPAAVAQATTMVATGEPVVAKGEKKKLKKEGIELDDRLIIIV